MKFKNAGLLVIAVATAAFCAAQGPVGSSGQYAKTVDAWNKPVDLFQIMGNIYYVGASDIAFGGRWSVVSSV
jgi:hypothetical protein